MAHDPEMNNRIYRALSTMCPGAFLMLLCFTFVACTPEPVPAPSSTADATAQRWEATSSNGTYSVVVRPAQGDPTIGAFQEWRISVSKADGSAVFPATIRMSGGMPAHGHGLPTQPQVTEHLGDGEYRIEGVRFNMAGEWVLNFLIDSTFGSDQVSLTIDMTF